MLGTSQQDLAALQVELYKQVLQSKSVAALMSGRASEPSDGVLSIITTLRKLCNHPDLLHSSAGRPPSCHLSPRLALQLVYMYSYEGLLMQLQVSAMCPTSSLGGMPSTLTQHDHNNPPLWALIPQHIPPLCYTLRTESCICCGKVTMHGMLL